MKNRICNKCGRERKIKWGERWYCGPCQRAKGRRYKENNRLLIRKKAREWKRRNYDRLQNKSKNIARKKWLLKGDVTREQLIELYESHGESCHYCGSDIKTIRFNPVQPLGFDHKTPRSRGGKHTIKNIVPCCADCNNKKNSRTYREYIEYRKSIVDPEVRDAVQT